LRSLAECSGCVADRVTNPDVRAQVERETVDAIVARSMLPRLRSPFLSASASPSDACDESRPPRILDIVMFADSGMYQTLCLVQRLVNSRAYSAVNVAIVDPFFAPLCFAPKRDVADDEKAALADALPRVAARCADFLHWFAPRAPPSSDDTVTAATAVTLTVYHHVSRWILAQRPVDVVCAIDWLDELGSLPSGAAIRGDLLVLELFAPTGALVVDFNVLVNRRLVIRTRSAHRPSMISVAALRDTDANGDGDDEKHGGSGGSGQKTDAAVLTRFVTDAISDTVRPEGEKTHAALFDEPPVFCQTRVGALTRRPPTTLRRMCARSVMCLSVAALALGVAFRIATKIST
jgi:hypothetical protein